MAVGTDCRRHGADAKFRQEGLDRKTVGIQARTVAARIAVPPASQTYVSPSGDSRKIAGNGSGIHVYASTESHGRNIQLVGSRSVQKPVLELINIYYIAS